MTKYVRVLNQTRGTVVAERCRVARSYWARMVGLIPVSHLNPGAGLLIPRTSAITMWFMRMSIDVAFSRADGTVVALARELHPWRFMYWARGAKDALELPGGALDASGTQVGDVLAFEPRGE